MPIVAVSGTREKLSGEDKSLIRDCLLQYEHDGFILHIGDCPTGVDDYVFNRWKSHGRNREKFEADWSKGPSAGPIRNGRMLEGAHVLVAFPSPRSSGTLNAIEQAIRKGIETHVYPIGRE